MCPYPCTIMKNLPSLLIFLALSTTFKHGSASSFFQFILKCCDFSAAQPEITNLQEIYDEVDVNRRLLMALEEVDSDNFASLLQVLPPLETLVSDSKQRLTISIEQRDMLICAYLKNMKYQENTLSYEPSQEILEVLASNRQFDIVKESIHNNIISKQSAGLYFINNETYFLNALNGGIISVLQVTETCILGHSLLHLIVERCNPALVIKVISNLSRKERDDVKLISSFPDGNTLLHSAIISGNLETVKCFSGNFVELRSKSNNFDQSPLKFALIHDSSAQIIKTLLNFGCFISNDDANNYDSSLTPEFVQVCDKDFPKLLNWNNVKNVDAVLEAKESMNIFVFIQSYNVFITEYDSCQMLGSKNTSSYSLLSSRSRSLSRSRSRSEPALLNIISSANMDLESDGIVKVSDIIGDFAFENLSSESKQILFSNLSKIREDRLDFSGTNQVYFINLIVEHSEPKVLAHFVRTHIDFYFCVRVLFGSCNNEDYTNLIPFLNELQFTGNTAFCTGLLPIHYAARIGNLNLIEFLMKHYSADLNSETICECNNIVHYLLRLPYNSKIIEFICSKCSHLVLTENYFYMTPFDEILLKSDCFALVSVLVKRFNKQLNEESFTPDPQLNDHLLSVLAAWPKVTDGDSSNKQFEDIYTELKSNKMRRLLLTHINRKIIKHLISITTKRSPHPSTISLNLSPTSPHGTSELFLTPRKK